MRYKARQNGEGLCKPDTYAWAFPSNGVLDVRLCPDYWTQDSRKRAVILIHEWMHLYFVAGDIRYEWDYPKFNNLNSLEALLNADS